MKIRQTVVPFVRSNCVEVSPGSLSTAILSAKCDSLEPRSLSISTHSRCRRREREHKVREAQVGAASLCRSKDQRVDRKYEAHTSDVKGIGDQPKRQNNEKVWLGSIRDTCTCMSQEALSCRKWVISRNLFCLPGREGMLIYMRGHVDQQIAKASSPFFANAIIGGSMMQGRWLEGGESLIRPDRR